MPQGDINPGAPVVIGSINAFQGMRVRDVQVQSTVDLHPDVLNDLLIQKPQQPLDKRKVRETVQALYATGKFSDVQVQANREAQDEVSLVFIGKENLFIGMVSAAGTPNPPSPNEVVTAAKLQLGELYTSDKVDAAVERIQRLLRHHGYYQAVVTPRLYPHRERQEMDVHFQVKHGPSARVGVISVEGSPGYDVKQIEHIAKLHPKDRVTADHVTRALTRLRSNYQKHGRLEAQVSITDRNYHADTNTLDYTFTMARGPVVDVKVVGARISRGKLKKYIPVYEENAVDEDLLNEGERNLRNYFQAKGFFDVKVDVNQETNPQSDRLNIIYAVNLGERHKLVAVDVTGNRYFPVSLIRDRLIVQPANGLLLRHGIYSETDLAADTDSIQNLYRANGFLNVTVKPTVQDNYQGVSGRMRVVYDITEGPQTRVEDLAFEGVTKADQQELLARLNSAPGQPYSPANVAADRDAILNYYYDNGFPNARLEPVVTPAGDNPPRMNIVYKITEGDQVFVDHVILAGLHYTKPFIVGREFQLWNGSPLSQSAELDTQRRLYDLGIFNEVNMGVQDPDGRAKYKNLLYTFDEAKRYTITYGFGVEAQTGLGTNTCPNQNTEAARRCRLSLLATSEIGISPRVEAGISRINFRGRNHTVTLKGNYGSLEKRAFASYEAPRWLDHPSLKLTFTSYFDRSNDVRTFAAERLEGSAQVQQTWSRVTTTLYRFSYRRVVANAQTLAIDPLDVPIFSRPARVGMPSFTYIRDKRDNPVETTKGNFNTLDFGTASGKFGSEADFSRLLFNNSTYQAFGGNKFVFARSTRIGVEIPHGSTVENPSACPTGQTCRIVPLPERFFAGGATSMRGFGLNEAGPRDPSTGQPLGGGTMFLNMFELRYPPLDLPFVGRNLSFVTFLDSGNVFTDPGVLFPSLLRWNQSNQTLCRTSATSTCDFNFLSHAVGTGIRYRTPIGPISLDLGYNLNPPYYHECDLPPSAPLDSTEPCIPVVKRTARINFFFNVGQTF